MAPPGLQRTQSTTMLVLGAALLLSSAASAEPGQKPLLQSSSGAQKLRGTAKLAAHDHAEESSMKRARKLALRRLRSSSGGKESQPPADLQEPDVYVTFDIQGQQGLLQQLKEVLDKFTAATSALQTPALPTPTPAPQVAAVAEGTSIMTTLSQRKRDDGHDVPKPAKGPEPAKSKPSKPTTRGPAPKPAAAGPVPEASCSGRRCRGGGARP